MTSAILGIDIAKDKFDIALIINGKIKSKVINNNPDGFNTLQTWLSERWRIDHVHACMEATGAYWENLAIFLADHGHTVSVVNPVRIKGFAQSEMSRNKTDKGDARLIARFCQSKTPDPWIAPLKEIRELQALVRRLDSLLAMQGMESNRLSTSDAVVVPSIKEHLDYLNLEIKKTQDQIKVHINQNPTLKKQRDLLDSIPGIGDKTIALVLAEIRSIDNFSKAKQLAAFAGLNPSLYESGTSVRGKTRLSKIGNNKLRKALFFPAMVAKRFNPVIADFAKRLEKNGKNKMTIIGAIMRKLIHIIYGVLKSGQPFNPAISLIKG